MPRMQAFIHQGPGHYVGSHVIVIAENYADAARLIRAELKEQGLEHEELDIRTLVTNMDDAPFVLFSLNGDY